MANVPTITTMARRGEERRGIGSVEENEMKKKSLEKKEKQSRTRPSRRRVDRRTNALPDQPTDRSTNGLSQIQRDIERLQCASHLLSVLCLLRLNYPLCRKCPCFRDQILSHFAKKDQDGGQDPSRYQKEQDRIHVYPSRVWVDRGLVLGYLSILAGAVRARITQT